MPVVYPTVPQPQSVDEFTTQAANAAQLIAEDAEPGEEACQPGQSLGPIDRVAQDEACNQRGALQTREAYLKKGEDLIRSLL